MNQTTKSAGTRISSSNTTTPPAADAARDSSPGTRTQLLVLTIALFCSYLAVATALPVVPTYVVQGLKMSNALGGLAVGIAFLSTILTRNFARQQADQRGGRPCMQRGLMLYSLASLICVAATWHELAPLLAFVVLLAGRLLLGVGESLVVVGMISWGLGLMGPARSGMVMAWVGAGMYGAFAVGGPVGLFLYNHFGFPGTALAGVIVPLLWGY